MNAAEPTLNQWASPVENARGHVRRQGFLRSTLRAVGLPSRFVPTVPPSLVLSVPAFSLSLRAALCLSVLAVTPWLFGLRRALWLWAAAAFPPLLSGRVPLPTAALLCLAAAAVAVQQRGSPETVAIAVASSAALAASVYRSRRLAPRKAAVVPPQAAPQPLPQQPLPQMQPLQQQQQQQVMQAMPQQFQQHQLQQAQMSPIGFGGRTVVPVRSPARSPVEPMQWQLPVQNQNVNAYQQYQSPQLQYQSPQQQQQQQQQYQYQYQHQYQYQSPPQQQQQYQFPNQFGIGRDQAAVNNALLTAGATAPYAPAPRPPVDTKRGENEAMLAQKHMESLGVTDRDINQMTSRLRRWLTSKVLRELNASLQRSVALSTLNRPGTPEHAAELCDKLEREGLIRWVNKWGNSVVPYVVGRIKELSSNSLAGYNWAEGGKFNGFPWTPDLPSDANLLLHLFCTFMDLSMRDATGKDNSFTSQYFVSTPLSPSRDKKQKVSIFVESQRPLHLKVVFNEDWPIPPGRENVYQALVMFILIVKKYLVGQLGTVHIGSGNIGLSQVWAP